MKTSQAHRGFENSRLAVFVSGRGSNLQALINSVGNSKIAVVVTNKKNATAVLKAKRSGIPVIYFSKDQSWEDLSVQLKRRRISLIYLLGFMKILPKTFCETWNKRMLNIHPSLLPLYPGLDSYEKGFANQDSLGVTLHEVTAEMDAGDKVYQYCFRKKGDFSRLHLEKERLSLAFVEHRLVRESGLRC